MITNLVRGFSVFSDNNKPSTRFFGNSELYAKENEKRIFIFFPLTENNGGLIPVDDNTLVATGLFHLYVNTNLPANTTITAKRITEEWDFTLLTYDNMPNVTDVNAATVLTSATAGTYIELDIKDILQDIVNNKDTGTYSWYGLEITVDKTSDCVFNSWESVLIETAPYLELTYSTPPDKPQHLKPNSSAIGTLTPTCSAQFTEEDVEDYCAKLQMQLHTTADFTTPDYDSGEIATNKPSYTYDGAALSWETEYFWRIRLADSYGVWSPWSEAASFTPLQQGTLEIASLLPNDRLPDNHDFIDGVDNWTLETADTNLVTEGMASIETDVSDFISGGTLTKVESGITIPMFGDSCLRTVVPSGIAGWASAIGSYVVIPVATLGIGRVYTFSFYGKGTGTMDMFMIEREGAIVRTSTIKEIVFTDQWQRFEVSAIVGLSYPINKISLQVLTASSQSITFYTDGIQLEAGPIPDSGNAYPNLLSDNQNSMEAAITGLYAFANTTISRDTDEYNFGDACLKVDTDGVGIDEGFTTYPDYVTVVPERYYIASFWVKGSGTFYPTLYEREADESGVGGTTLSVITATGTWTRYSIVRLFSNVGVLAEFFVKTSAALDVDIWFDGIMITRADTGWHLPGEAATKAVQTGENEETTALLNIQHGGYNSDVIGFYRAAGEIKEGQQVAMRLKARSDIECTVIAKVVKESAPSTEFHSEEIALTAEMTETVVQINTDEDTTVRLLLLAGAGGELDTDSYFVEIDNFSLNKLNHSLTPEIQHTFIPGQNGTQEQIKRSMYLYNEEDNISEPLELHDWRLEEATILTLFEETSSYLEADDDWEGVEDGAARGGTYIQSVTTDDTAIFTFYGTGVDLIAYKDDNFGIAEIYIDDVYQEDIDLYAAAPAYQETVASYNSLDGDVEHTITIKVTGTKHASSSDYIVNIDGFDVDNATPSYTVDNGVMMDEGIYRLVISTKDAGTVNIREAIENSLDYISDEVIFEIQVNETLPECNTEISFTHEETDLAMFVYTGTWVPSTVLDEDYSNGYYTESNETDAFVVFTFYGTDVTWIGTAGPDAGIAEVFIDGVSKGMVDLYSSVEVYQQNLYQESDMVAGSHTIKIVVTGTKNGSSSDYIVYIDAFTVLGEFEMPEAEEDENYEETYNTDMYDFYRDEEGYE